MPVSHILAFLDGKIYHTFLPQRRLTIPTTECLDRWPPDNFGGFLASHLLSFQPDQKSQVYQRVFEKLSTTSGNLNHLLAYVRQICGDNPDLLSLAALVFFDKIYVSGWVLYLFFFSFFIFFFFFFLFMRFFSFFPSMFRPHLIEDTAPNFHIFRSLPLRDRIDLFRKEKMAVALFLHLVADVDPLELTETYRDWVVGPLNRMYESSENQKTAKIIDSLSRMFDFPMMAALNVNDSKKLAHEIWNRVGSVLLLFSSLEQ